MSVDLADTVEPTGSFAIAQQIKIKGGHHQVATITERNNIPSARRIIGMIVSVAETSRTYQLVAGITNADWVALPSIQKVTALAAANVSAGATIHQTVTVTGAALLDSITVTLSGGSGSGYSIQVTPHITTTDTVLLTITNTNASTAQPVLTDGVTYVLEHKKI